MLIVITGASGSGKSTIGNYLEEKGIKQLVSHTTRKMRKGEVHGKDYYYVDKQEFETLDLVERVNYSGNNYGFTKKELFKAKDTDTIYFVIVNYDGYLTMLREIGEENVYSIYVDITNGLTDEEFLKVLKKRMELRGDNQEHIQSRLDYYLDTKNVEDKLRNVCDYIIYNKVLEDTKKEVDFIINSLTK